MTPKELRSGARFQTVVLGLLLAAPTLAFADGNAGFLNGGLDGAYYATPTLPAEGTPAVFTRREPRLRFDLGTTGEVGGSSTPGRVDFPKDNFSVRFTGEIVSRFTEVYTFHTTADDGVRLYLRAVGAPTWTPVIDNWPAGGQTATERSGTFAMTAGVPCEILVEYRELTGPASLTLEWESEHEPRQIIEPSTELSINMTHPDGLLADAFKAGRASYIDSTPDARGWPTSDFQFIYAESFAPNGNSPLERGTLSLSFTGRGDVSTFGNVEVVAGSFSYDPIENRTSGLLFGNDDDVNVAQFRVTNTDRDGDYGADGLPDQDGVTEIVLMRPDAPGSATPLPEGTVTHPLSRAAYERFTQLRYQRINDQSVDWDDRAPGGYALRSRSNPYIYNDRYNGGAWNLRGSTGFPHELEIEICNELGIDYYVTVPHFATVGGPGTYIHNLALLIKYGSDENGIPYTSPQPNPVHPPLNSNLNCYVEISNELWNFLSVAVYAPWFDYRELIEDFADSNHPDMAILNFDNLPTTQNAEGYHDRNYTWVRRYWGLHLKRISDDFRDVFGDADMPGNGNRQPRIRPYFTWQYANANNTADVGLAFMDNYFNNRAGNFVATPRPVDYYFWSGGGAGYYSSANRNGFFDTNPIPNFSAEEPVVADFVERPSIPNWTFANGAGIARTPALGLPQPMNGGQQAFYLHNVGGVQARAEVTFAIPEEGQTDDTYGLSFRWVNREVGGAPDQSQFRIFTSVDGGAFEDITPIGPNTQPQTYSPSHEWRRIFFNIGDYFWSETFTAPPGSTVTIRFEGNNPTGDHMAFLDEIYLSSAHVFFASDIPSTGAATGQTSGTYLGNQQGDSDWCAAFGLEQMTYEHGYSAGGDAGNSPLQDYCKFVAPGARTSCLEAVRIFQEAGGRVPTFGTYSTWPVMEVLGDVRVEGTINAGDWPLTQGMDDAAGRLAFAPTYGTSVPATIPESEAALRYPLFDNPKDWWSFNINVANPGMYSVAAETTGTGTIELSLGGSEVIATGAAGGSLVGGAAYLPYGVSAVRVQRTSGNVDVVRIIIDAATSLPPAPEDVSATLRPDLAVDLTWTDMSAGDEQEQWFEIERATDPAFTENVASFISGQDTEAYTDTTQLPVDTTYYYRVRSSNLLGVSDWAEANAVYMPVPAATDTLFAYEPFDGPAGALHQVATGFGWSDPWDVQGGEAQGFEVLETNPLVWPDLVTNGTGYASGGYAFRTAGRSLDLVPVPYWFKRTEGAAQYGTSGTELWISALVRIDNADASGRLLILSSNAGNLAAVNEGHRVRLARSNGNWAVEARDAAQAWQTAEATVPADVGTTHLVVLRLAFGASQDTVDLFIDPAPLMSPIPTAPDVTLTTDGDLFFRSLAFNPGSAEARGSLDEVRLGDSYAAVTPMIGARTTEWLLLGE